MTVAPRQKPQTATNDGQRFYWGAPGNRFLQTAVLASGLRGNRFGVQRSKYVGALLPSHGTWVASHILHEREAFDEDTPRRHGHGGGEWT